uniref:Uncharacterized protein n=1 Tax=Physcomitrium patens TaxID=3218 RepID=A0A2K1IMB9_PHYPA|nr:hypothetical protein PHYPA_026733 [Physcomitrium patens]PNR30419.1 hypothetical protein PHYPA_026735 [Physcomitrium patens]
MAHRHMEVIDGRCLGAPRWSCSECNMDNIFRCFATTDGSLLRAKSPGILRFPDVGHRCKRFPCPICNPSPHRRPQRRQVEDSQVPDMIVTTMHRQSSWEMATGGPPKLMNC